MSLTNNIPITGTIVPTHPLDKYAVIDPFFGIDGLRNVDTHAQRNSIPVERRREGMIVSTLDDKKYWRLKTGPWDLTDNDWDLFINTVNGEVVIGNKYLIESGETITVPPNCQYWIYGDLTIQGKLDNKGEIIIANGSLIIDGGTYSNTGNITLLGLQTGGSSVGERVNISDRFLSALDTTSNGDLACASPISNSPKNDSYVSVFVNGVEYEVGNGVKTKDCYFSGDGGFTAKSFSSSHPNGKIVAGDQLYWNGSISGLQLQNIWKISFNYIY